MGKAQNESHSEGRPLWWWLFTAGVSLTFLGRGWISYFRDTSWREFFWAQDKFGPVMTFLTGHEWQIWAAVSDPFIVEMEKAQGLFLAMAGILVWFLAARRYIIGGVVIMASLLIFSMILITTVINRVGEIGFQVEHALQFGPGVLLVLWAYRLMRTGTVMGWARVLTAMTFFGHGLYAIGYYFIPGEFMIMTQSILGLSKENALLMLKIVAILDFVAALLILTPRWGAYLALVWIVPWGLATAVARTWANFSPAQNWYGLDPWLAETLLRFVHWMIPLAIAFHMWTHYKQRARVPKPAAGENVSAPVAAPVIASLARENS